MSSKSLPLMMFLIGAMLTSTAFSQENTTPPWNQLILDCIRTMPPGGGYSAGNTATQALRHAVRISNGMLQVDATHAMPSYCSGATYLVFLKVISLLQNDHRLTLSSTVLEALRPMGQPDGTGVWGRWNANGPGTARLFYELGLGRNFTGLAAARSGDFLKIWWSDSIGASEHGHSVIYMGLENRNGVASLSYWSSNIPGGFGVRSVPMNRIRRMLFSRLENPGTLERLATLPTSDHYLSSLQTRSSTAAEMASVCGMR